MINAIKKAKRGRKKDMFGKKYKCFGCEKVIKRFSKVICFREIGMLGLLHLQVILCIDCAKKVHDQIIKILIQKVKRVLNIEDSIHST